MIKRLLRFLKGDKQVPVRLHNNYGGFLYNLSFYLREWDQKSEIGGLLYGRRRGDEIQIFSADLIKNVAPDVGKNYMADPGEQQRIIMERIKNRIYEEYKFKHIGDFHTHPNSSPKVSRTDLQCIKQVFKDHLDDYYILVIASCRKFLPGFEAWVYIFDRATIDEYVTGKYTLFGEVPEPVEKIMIDD